jgi:hypothetical protein
MSVARAFADGWARVRRAPALVAGIWLTTVLLAWPLALTLRGLIADHLGSSLAAETAASGMNFDWWNEFLAQTAGIGQTFVPAVLGFAAVLKNISSIADAVGVPTSIGGVIAAYILLSIFVMGGVLDRLARDRRLGSYAFFAACGLNFFRLLRLSVIAGAIYWVLFAWLHEWMFGALFTALTHTLTVERTAIFYRTLLYGVFAIVVGGANIVFDYAKVRLVVEDRRSAIGAVVSAARFVARNAGAVAGLYLLDLLVFLIVLALYALIAPGAAGGLAAWIGFLIGQLYITLRVVVRLLFTASEVALFQGRLAHAGYTAAPVPEWPDSPAAAIITPE